MSRFFVEPNQIQGNSIIIESKTDVQHISKVLRLRVSDEIDVSDGCSWEYTCEITEINKGSVFCRILDKQKFAREPETKITLFQGVPKQGKLDLVVQKTVELGISQITPVFMKRTVINDKGGFGKKVARFRTIAEEAAKQCQRGVVPTISEAINFDQAVEEMKDYDLVIFPYENEEGLTIKDGLRGLEKKPEKVAIIIGPEGGFADEEADVLKESGAMCVSLGKTILRTETAGITSVAMAMYELEL